MAMAAVAMTFTSCGNKAKTEVPADEQQAEVTALVDNATEQISALLDEGDANKLGEYIEAIKVKVTELLTTNPEVAKEYLSKVQSFLKENADKVKAAVGENELVNTAVSTLVETPAESIISNLQQVIGTVENAGQEAVEGAVDQANEAADAAKLAVEDKANEVKDAAEQKVEETKQAAADKVNEAAQKVNDKVNEGADKLLKGAGLK